MTIISDFSSLVLRDYKNPFEEQVDWYQIFSPEDIIRVQARSTDFIYSVIINLNTGSQTVVSPDIILIETGLNIYTWNLNIGIGDYEFRLVQQISGYIYTRHVFKVTDNEECLNDTVLIRYSHYKNEFNVVFLNPETNEQYLFDIRLKGGFIYRETNFMVDDEQFRDQNYTNHQMSAFPYYSRTLTIGKGSDGVPIWVGDKLNKAFSVSNVSVNGELFTRSEGSIPEKIEIGLYNPLYIFKINLEPSDIYSQTVDAQLKDMVSNTLKPVITNTGTPVIANT